MTDTLEKIRVFELFPVNEIPFIKFVAEAGKTPDSPLFSFCFDDAIVMVDKPMRGVLEALIKRLYRLEAYHEYRRRRLSDE